MQPSEIEQTNLVLRVRPGSGGKVYWDAQWRVRLPGEAVEVAQEAARAGLARADGAGGWRKRKGRCQKGWLDERAATIAADEAMRQHAIAVAGAEEAARRERERAATVRELAADWLLWLEQVRGAKPSTLRDYQALLREPGTPYKRGAGEESRPDHGGVRRPARR